MTALVLDGKQLATQIETQLATRVAAIKARSGERLFWPLFWSGRPCLGYLCKDEGQCLHSCWHGIAER
jgi:hypothetical protein